MHDIELYELTGGDHCLLDEYGQRKLMEAIQEVLS